MFMNLAFLWPMSPGRLGRWSVHLPIHHWETPPFLTPWCHPLNWITSLARHSTLITIIHVTKYYYRQYGMIWQYVQYWMTRVSWNDWVGKNPSEFINQSNCICSSLTVKNTWENILDTARTACVEHDIPVTHLTLCTLGMHGWLGPFVTEKGSNNVEQRHNPIF